MFSFLEADCDSGVPESLMWLGTQSVSTVSTTLSCLIIDFPLNTLPRDTVVGAFKCLLGPGDVIVVNKNVWENTSNRPAAKSVYTGKPKEYQ